jgi:drug/metabolite transporter (DMT)-like permease
MLQKHGALVSIAWVFTYGALALAPVGLLPALRDGSSWSPHALQLVAWMVLVPTVIAYLTNAWALERARSSMVAAYIYLQPLLVAISASVMLSEGLSLRTGIAGLAILAGLTVIATRTLGARVDKNRAGAAPEEARSRDESPAVDQAS